MLQNVVVRKGSIGDLDAILTIYNQGIEDRVATLDSDPKSRTEIAEWWEQHDDRYRILVATEDDGVIGWASLNRFSHRCAHSAIADLSVYVERAHRGQGIGSTLMGPLEDCAREAGFRKIVLHTHNTVGVRLYRKCGFREVGVFREHGILDGRMIDIVAMEKLL